MPKTRKKPVPPSPAPPRNRPGPSQGPATGKADPRLQADQRWQRTKRYGWDSR
ncbi:MAG TPA: hypothetical protein VJ576_05535 [Rhodocyclaceae bacterium]|nr:hypothetical protein [Rhodocyclaceae bacterium]